MSGLPTLLVPGSIRAEGADPAVTPLAHIQAWLRKRMPEFGGRGTAPADRVLVVRAETGSGKSTVLPVGVYRILRGEKTHARLRHRGPGVICTQPRVLTALALAADVSSERLIGGARTRINPDMVFGDTVGFQTGPVSNNPPGGLLYATAGVLAAQLQNQDDLELMGRYQFIIVDEAHERSLDSDIMLSLLRDFYERNAGNARLPFLLLTSATFDTAAYAAYFGVGAANVVEVVGRAHPIAVHWPARGTNDYPAEAAAVALRIHETHPDDRPERADVLIFMPGAAETTAVARALQSALEGPAYAGPSPAHRPFLVLTINREVVIAQSGDYPLVFEAPGRLPAVGGRPPARRIVVSTVVAETGLTIDTLRYVIDCGWSRAREVYQPSGAEGLITRPAPQSRIKQRQGRVGRLFPGDFYPLYTQAVFAALDAQQLPEIVSSGLGDRFLAIVGGQQRQKLRTGRPPEFRLEDLALLDPPPPEAFLAANAAATALGFVSARAPLPRRWPPAELVEAVEAAPPEGPHAQARGYGLTALGHLGALFSRTPMRGVRVLLAGYVWGAAAADLATAVAMFGTPLADLRSAGGAPPGAPPPGALPPGAAALRAALPAFLAGRAGGGALPPAESEAFYFRWRLLIADDFAEAVVLFDAFARRLDASRGDLAAVAGWCAEAGLGFGALLEAARRRDAILEDMASAGLDPFRASERRLAALPLEGFTEGVRALKRCLYDGLRDRLLQWVPDHPGGPAYVTPQGLRVQTPPLFTDAMASRLKALHVTQGPADALRPRWLLTDQVRLTPARAGAPLLYAAAANLVSVLDGYVDPDPGLGGPRAFADFPPPGFVGPPI